MIIHFIYEWRGNILAQIRWILISYSWKIPRRQSRVGIKLDQSGPRFPMSCGSTLWALTSRYKHVLIGRRMRKGSKKSRGGSHSVSWGESWYLLLDTLTTVFCPELSHMVMTSWKGDWKIQTAFWAAMYLSKNVEALLYRRKGDWISENRHQSLPHNLLINNRIGYRTSYS